MDKTSIMLKIFVHVTHDMASRKLLERAAISRVRQLFEEKPRAEKFISWHPERYGFDRATYCAVVVVNDGGETRVYPARYPDTAQRIFKAL